MVERTIPASFVESYVRDLRAGIASIERFLGAQSAVALIRVAKDLEQLINEPRHTWVSTSEAARIHGVSEETIRRWCRNGNAPFRFTEENGRYLIWLPDLQKAAA